MDIHFLLTRQTRSTTGNNNNKPITCQSINLLVSSVQYVGGLSIGTLLTQLLKYTGAAKPDLAVFIFYLGLLISSFYSYG